jgi:hypothetical protein
MLFSLKNSFTSVLLPISSLGTCHPPTPLFFLSFVCPLSSESSLSLSWPGPSFILNWIPQRPVRMHDRCHTTFCGGTAPHRLHEAQRTSSSDRPDGGHLRLVPAARGVLAAFLPTTDEQAAAEKEEGSMASGFLLSSFTAK